MTPKLTEMPEKDREAMKQRAYERWRDYSLAERCVQWIEQGRKMANENARTTG